MSTDAVAVHEGLMATKQWPSEVCHQIPNLCMMAYLCRDSRIVHGGDISLQHEKNEKCGGVGVL